MRYLLLIRGDESAAAHADEGCSASCGRRNDG
jgi:hypothetical protein